MKRQPDEILLPFYFGKCVAGCLILEVLTLNSGIHRYMPVRSIGHYNLSQAVRGQGRAYCHVDAGKQRFYFSVSDIPEYGVLELNLESIGNRPVWSINKLLWNLLYSCLKLTRFAFKFLLKIIWHHD